MAPSLAKLPTHRLPQQPWSESQRWISLAGFCHLTESRFEFSICALAPELKMQKIQPCCRFRQNWTTGHGIVKHSEEESESGVASRIQACSKFGSRGPSALAGETSGPVVAEKESFIMSETFAGGLDMENSTRLDWGWYEGGRTCWVGNCCNCYLSMRVETSSSNSVFERRNLDMVQSEYWKPRNGEFDWSDWVIGHLDQNDLQSPPASLSHSLSVKQTAAKIYRCRQNISFWMSSRKFSRTVVLVPGLLWFWLPS